MTIEFILMLLVFVIACSIVAYLGYRWGKARGKAEQNPRGKA